VTAHADEPSIEYVSAGSTVRAEVPSFLLPESKYDTCLLKARELSILEGYVDALRVEVVAPLQGCQGALKEGEKQITLDARRIAGLEQRLEVIEETNKDLRRQRNTAYAVAGALIVGSVSAFGVSVALR
jgi:hypothetical protein